LLGHLVTDARASDSMFLFIDFVRVTNCFYDYDYDYRKVLTAKSRNYTWRCSPVLVVILISG